MKTPPKTAKLTSALVEKLPATGVRYEVLDTEITGFHVRVSQNGVKTYSFRYRNRQGKRCRFKIGNHPGKTADDARKRALSCSGQVADGKDPQAEKAAQRRQGKAHTLRQFIEGDYQRWATANRRTGQGTVNRLLASFPDLLDKPLTAITAWLVEKWRAARHKSGISASTTDRDIIALRALFTHAVIAGHVEKNPLSGFKLTRPDNRRIRFLSDAEETRLRKALTTRESKMRAEQARYAEWCKARGKEPPADTGHGYADHLQPLVLLALNTGARRGELLGLTWESVDLQRAILTVQAHTAKAAKTRHIPLNLEALEVLRTWRPKNARGLVFEGRNGQLGSVKTSWGAVIEAAKIEDFTFHDLRHTFASRLVQAGVSLAVVRDLLGHASIQMTERYAHLAPDMKAEAVAKLARGQK